MTTRERIFSDISAERERQDARWGPAISPFVGNPHAELQKMHGEGARFEAKSAALIECHRLGIPSEREAKEAVESAFARGEGTFAHLTVEELSEAVSAAVIHGEASDETRRELVQAAALIVAVIERIDRTRGVTDEPRKIDHLRAAVRALSGRDLSVFECVSIDAMRAVMARRGWERTDLGVHHLEGYRSPGGPPNVLAYVPTLATSPYGYRTDVTRWCEAVARDQCDATPAEVLTEALMEPARGPDSSAGTVTHMPGTVPAGAA